MDYVITVTYLPSSCCNGLCNYCYIGETQRPIRERFKEHVNSVRHCMTDRTVENKPVALHFRKKHPQNISVDQPFRIRLIDTATDCVDRKIRETIAITEMKPLISEKGSSWRVLPPR